MRWTPDSLAAAAHGRLRRRGSRPIETASIDSRSLRPGALFVPIVAARDGHEFIPAAIAAGAAAVLVGPGRPVPDGDVTVVEVADTLRAFGDLARDARKRVQGPVVAITGSNGKTTTRSMVAAVLAADGRRVLATRGNFNNYLGVPLTMLDTPHEPEAMVIELGMSAPGENAHLAELVQPNIGVITSIALEHLEFLGSLEAIAAAEAEIVESIAPEGILVVPDEAPLIDRHIPPDFAPEVMRFGRSAAAGVRIESVVQQQRTRARIRLPDGRPVTVALQLFGAHNAYNAAIALGIGHRVGIGGPAMVAALESVTPVGDRGRVLTHGTHWIIADCYNANPGSVEAALRSLVGLRDSRSGPLIAVLGDMLELGSSARKLHAAVGALAAELELDLVLALGPLSRATAEAARAGGIEALHCDGLEGAASVLSTRLGAASHAAVLVKGSRGMRLERIIEHLMAEGASRAAGPETT